MMIKAGIWMLLFSKCLFVLSAIGLIYGFNKFSSIDSAQNSEFITEVITRNTWLSISGLIIVLVAVSLLVVAKLTTYLQKNRKMDELEEIVEEIEELPI